MVFDILMIFEVVDKSGRKIHLSKERWSHIITKHPYMSNYLAEIEETIKNPQKIVSRDIGNLFDFYNYQKLLCLTIAFRRWFVRSF